MSVPTKTLTATIYDSQGNAVSGAKVVIKLSAFDLYENQIITNDEITATTNASGIATASIFPNTLGERNTFYNVKAQNAAQTVTYWTTTIVMPNVNSHLDNISPSHPPTAEDTGVSSFVTIPFLDQTSRYESYLKNWNTAGRVYTFPDYSGTVLLDADIATQAEVTAGSDAVRIVTPATLNGAYATTLMAPVTASGGYVDITGIPSGVKEIVVHLVGLHGGGVGPFISPWLVQLGDSGGIETSGYSGFVSYYGVYGLGSTWLTDALSSGGMNIAPASTSDSSGYLVFSLVDTNTWACQGATKDYPQIHGTKSLSGELDRIRITSQGNTFDAGDIYVTYKKG